MKTPRAIYGILIGLSILIGCDNREVPGEIKVRDLTTGNVTTHPAGESLPGGSIICGDPDCSIPKEIACSSLGQEVCLLQPECRLKEVWCMGQATSSSDSSSSNGGEGASSEPKTSCEYICIPKLPLLCEELTEEQACSDRADCTWGAFQCPACADINGQGCECKPTCQTRSVPVCQGLTEQDCQKRADCGWNQAVCPECGADRDCGCSAICQPISEPQPTPITPPIGECRPTGCSGEVCSDREVVTDCVVADHFECFNLTACARMANGTCGWLETPDFSACMTGHNTKTPGCKRTGCSGQVCSDKEEFTTCEWADYYVCYDNASCGITANGTCGWIVTAEYSSCMSSYGK
jgi:eight-cysteine-cluster-containing protein